jgi:hypothetical protein
LRPCSASSAIFNHCSASFFLLVIIVVGVSRRNRAVHDGGETPIDQPVLGDVRRHVGSCWMSRHSRTGNLPFIGTGKKGRPRLPGRPYAPSMLRARGHLKLARGADDVVDQLCKLHSLRIEFELAGLDLREVEHLVNEAE